MTPMRSRRRTLKTDSKQCCPVSARSLIAINSAAGQLGFQDRWYSYVYVCVYIYIYIERERERASERARETSPLQNGLSLHPHLGPLTS